MIHTLSFAHIFYKTKKDSTYGGLIKYILYEVYTSTVYNIFIRSIILLFARVDYLNIDSVTVYSFESRNSIVMSMISYGIKN